MLCFVDPTDLSSRFETLKSLSNTAKADFLCLIAAQMDAKRAESHYVGENEKIDRFVGTNSWRERWEAERAKGEDFGKFIATTFAEQMEGIGFQKTELHMMKEIRTDERNVPLYYLALFSKSPIAFGYWEEVRKYSTSQRGFDWGE